MQKFKSDANLKFTPFHPVIPPSTAVIALSSNPSCESCAPSMTTCPFVNSQSPKDRIISFKGRNSTVKLCTWITNFSLNSFTPGKRWTGASRVTIFLTANLCTMAAIHWQRRYPWMAQVESSNRYRNVAQRFDGQMGQFRKVGGVQWGLNFVNVGSIDAGMGEIGEVQIQLIHKILINWHD